MNQTIDDKPSTMSDKLAVVATASITWFLISTTNSGIVDAGTAGGTATLHGKIGDELKVTFDGDALQLAAL